MVKIVDIIFARTPFGLHDWPRSVDLDQLSTVPMLVKLKTLIAHIAKILTLGFLFNNFWWYRTPLIWTLTPNQLFQASIRFSNLIWLD